MDAGHKGRVKRPNASGLTLEVGTGNRHSGEEIHRNLSSVVIVAGVENESLGQFDSAALDEEAASQSTPDQFRRLCRQRGLSQ